MSEKTLFTMGQDLLLFKIMPIWIYIVNAMLQLLIDREVVTTNLSIGLSGFLDDDIIDMYIQRPF